MSVYSGRSMYYRRTVKNFFLKVRINVRDVSKGYQELHITSQSHFSFIVLVPTRTSSSIFSLNLSLWHVVTMYSLQSLNNFEVSMSPDSIVSAIANPKPSCIIKTRNYDYKGMRMVQSLINFYFFTIIYHWNLVTETQAKLLSRNYI